MNEPTTASGAEYVMVPRADLAAIANFAHDHSTGPEDVDTLWRVKQMIVDLLAAAPRPASSAVAGEDRVCASCGGSGMQPTEDGDAVPCWPDCVEKAFASPSAPSQGQEGDDRVTARNTRAWFNVIQRSAEGATKAAAMALAARCNELNAGELEVRIEGVTDGDNEIGNWTITARLDDYTPPAPDGGEAVAIWRLLDDTELTREGDEFFTTDRDGCDTWSPLAAIHHDKEAGCFRMIRRRALAVIHPSAPKAGDTEKAS